jgi:glycosyltransferase involved in cell wall biosynthesis
LDSKIIFFIPSVKSYRDRIALLLQLSAKINLLVLLIGTLDEELDVLKYPNVIIVVVGFKRGLILLNHVKSSIKASKLVRTHKIKVVHDTFGFLLLYFIKEKIFKSDKILISSFYCIEDYRIKVTWNGLTFWRALMSRQRALMYYGLLIQRLLQRFAHIIVLQTHGLETRLLNYSPRPVQTAVLSNSVDTRFWTPSYKRELKSGEPLKLLYIGGIGPSRGAPILIELVSRLRFNRKNVELCLMGAFESGFEQSLRNQVREAYASHAVEFLAVSSRLEVRRKLRESDVFCYQTDNDASPRIILEALSTGITIIASRHPGILGYDENESTIIFTDYADIDQIYSAVIELINNKDELKMRAKRGRELVLKHYSTEEVASKYYSFYRDVIEKRGN